MIVWVCVRVLPVYNKVQAQWMSKREFELWTILRGTEVCVFVREKVWVIYVDTEFEWLDRNSAISPTRLFIEHSL